jgi:predicted RNA binding protein YcfA (HicA-like mRNA interferase family)
VAKLPRISGQEMARFLQRLGFQLVRVRGSHHYFARGSTHTTVPVHGNHNLRVGTLRSVLRDVEISPTDFERLLNQK